MANPFFSIIRDLVGTSLLAIILGSSLGWAAPKKPKNEIYSATEGDEVLTVSTTVSSRKPKSIEPSPSPKKKRVKATSKPEFETVPAEQVESIAGRIKLVEVLLRDHGRAYDYRTMTTRQLQAILDRLDSEQASANSPTE